MSISKLPLVSPCSQFSPKPLTCTHCGHSGIDVVPITEFVGGQGFEVSIKCRDQVACWQRWDHQHGLPVWDESRATWSHNEPFVLKGA
jgi:hypothetical protein